MEYFFFKLIFIGTRSETWVNQLNFKSMRITKISTLPKKTAFCLVFLLPFLSSAQFSYKVKTSNNISPVGSFVPNKTEIDYSPILQAEEMPHPNAHLDREIANKRKAERTEIPQFKNNSTFKVSKTTPKPQVLDSLNGNNYSGSVPNDDDFAIGRNQQILRVRNSTIGAYDYVKDSLLYELTLFRFYRPTQFLPGSKYDPRAIYDPESDRFIVLYLSGNTWENSTIIIGFSKSNDLADGFNIYRINGNPLNDSTWSDYPHITVNKDDLFITMNTFYNGSSNNSGYVQTTIRQIGKQAGYDSLALTEHYYYNLEYGGKNLFSFTGIDNGKELLPAPTYFLGSRALDPLNDSIFVAKIDDKATGNPQLSLEVYTTETNYGLPPSARQKNNHTFDCNDCRIQGGFMFNQRIQYVGNTITPTGNAGFYHGIIDLRSANKTNSYFKIINLDPIDVGYPQVTFTGKSGAEVESILTFNHSGDSLNAGFSAIFFDNDSSYSERTQIVEGGDYIDIISSNGDRTYERWGDYTGNQLAYGDTGTIWATGYEASPQGVPLTVLAKLRSPNWDQTPISDIGLKEEASPKISLSPNPSIDWFRVEIEQEKEELLNFSLYQLDGKNGPLFQVEELALAGVNSFRFRTDRLAKGLYILKISNAKGELIGQEKVVVK